MFPFSGEWTAPMRQGLSTLQRQPLLRQILTYARERRVRLYVVGGALRDIYMGRVPHDLDLAMAGDVLGFTRRLADHLGAAYVPLDAERGEVRLVYRKRLAFDFARLRGDDVYEDLRHRDFTINAMACTLEHLLFQSTPEVIDPHGGVQDIQARLIRMVSLFSFHEDPLRLLRAFRFAASLAYAIDPLTLAHIEAVAPRLSQVAVERIHSELFKLFSATDSSAHVVTMARVGLLDVMFPELSAGQSLMRAADGPPSPFGHALDTYEAVEQLINTPLADLSVIADDIVTYLRDGERAALVKCAALMHTSGDLLPGRETASQAPLWECLASSDAAEHTTRVWEQIANRLKLSRQRTEYVAMLLAHRRQPFALAALAAQGGLTPRLVHHWSKELGEDMLGAFTLAIGDAMAYGQCDDPVRGSRALGQCAVTVWGLYRQHVRPVLQGPRLITGNDLQQVFHLSPGPAFKTLLDALEVAQIEGHVHTRSEALQWMERRLKQP
jgi:poly(A) polymerase